MNTLSRVLCAVAYSLCVAVSFTACDSGGSSVPPPAAASPATIITVAGKGVGGSGISATAAQLNILWAWPSMRQATSMLSIQATTASGRPAG